MEFFGEEVKDEDKTRIIVEQHYDDQDDIENEVLKSVPCTDSELMDLNS